MAFQGQDRRRHKVFITRNTEYHVKDDVCVAVRDVRTKRWQVAHIALSRKVEGAVRIFSNGAVVPNLKEPVTGDAIYFSDTGPSGDERQIVTSRIVSIGRPPKSDVAQYGRFAHA